MTKLGKVSVVVFSVGWVAIVITFMAGGFSSNGGASNTPTPAAAPATHTPSPVAIAAKQKMCIDQVDALISSSIALLNKNDPAGARGQLAPCVGTMTDQRAIALLAKATKLQADLLAKATKLREAADLEAEKKRRKLELAEKKKHGVTIGMTMQEVLDSSWGKPRSINKTTNANGTHEQWVYGGGYLYFDGEVLTTIQN